ncbi:ribonuclease E activity regulator RraA [Micromonospora sp. NPDC005087]|uniref:ribonuclease E activity regulator RraA n=1 Tax=Micromonospora sp. NPDC005087 TaxID=3364225 RepID=UPI00369E6405
MGGPGERTGENSLGGGPQATADLMDDFDPNRRACRLVLRHFGGKRSTSGIIRTVLCCEDNALVGSVLREKGDGRILVIDGDGSTASALVGDAITAVAIENGWNGIVVNGAVRDAAAIAELPIVVLALGTNPTRSTKDGWGFVDVPVQFGRVTFAPGARAWIDDDGLVVELATTG